MINNKCNAKNARLVWQSCLMLFLVLIMGNMLVACGENSPTSVSTTTTTVSTQAAATPVPTSTSMVALATVTPAPSGLPATNITSNMSVTAPTVAATAMPVTAPTVVATTQTTAATTILADTTTVAPTASTSVPTSISATSANLTDRPTSSLSATAPPLTSATGKLAYVESGNLYIYDLSSQTKTMLYQATGTTGVVGIPSWSPDNSHLAVTLREDIKNVNSRTNLYLLKSVGGDPQKVMVSGLVATCEENPVWSPDGRYVAFVEVLDQSRSGKFSVTNQREVWTVDANGQNSRKVADGLEPGWSADSNSLAYVTNGSAKAGAAFKQNNAIHITKLVNGRASGAANDLEILTTAKIPNDLTPYGIPFGAGIYFLHTPVFLNNDKTLGFVAQGATGLVATISTISTAGIDLKLWDAEPEGGFGRAFTDPTKGNHLMYEALPPSGISHIHIVDISAAPLPTRVNLINFGGEKLKESANNPSWSPDGSQIAYLYQTDGNSLIGTTGIPGALAIATSQATKAQTLVKGVLTAVAWSH